MSQVEPTMSAETFQASGNIFTRTRGRSSLHPTDLLSYLWLLFGTVVMFGPVIWVLMSSFKTQAALIEFPPQFLPFQQDSVQVEGHDDPLPLYDVTLEDGSIRQLAQVRRCKSAGTTWMIRTRLTSARPGT